jgi:hypothetical protein
MGDVAVNSAKVAARNTTFVADFPGEIPLSRRNAHVMKKAFNE